MRYLLLFLLILFQATGIAAAADFEPHQNILDTARDYAFEQAGSFPGEIEVSTGRLDRRLRLAPCEVPLQAYESPNGLKPGRNAVGVRCEGAKPWKIYVTVNIATTQAVVVTTRALARGELLKGTDLKIEKRDTGRIHKGFFTEFTPVAGLRVKRRVAANRILEPGMLERRQLVKRGSAVEIVADQGALQVRMKGKALSDGTLGERIRVRNRASGREITGEVIASGVIQVTP